MCILFLYVGADDDESDYKLIMISNRDEYYNRPADNMAPWSEDSNIIGGRDLKAGGTWLAVSPYWKKIGVLLNLPGTSKKLAKSRGAIVTDFMKCRTNTCEYINSINEYVKECNEFLFVTVEFLNSKPTVKTYDNVTNTLKTYDSIYLGFGNSLPETPLKKIESGRDILKDISTRLNKISEKEKLIQELIGFLKSDIKYLPDPELERRCPNAYNGLSSIFVNIPEEGYGTRTHTILLITKNGDADLIEISLQSPVDNLNPIWKRSEFRFVM